MIYYVTSFDRKIYKKTGKQLLKSYNKYQRENLFFVCYENMRFKGKPNIVGKNITNHPLLVKFLEKNIDIIPTIFGGKAKPCTKCCSKAHSATSCLDYPKCYYSWFNANCFRYFRKFVSLSVVINSIKKDSYLVWLDSDCYFCKYLSDKKIYKLFQGKEYFYCNGNKRRVDDTGIFGLKLTNNVIKMINSIINDYLNGTFTQLERWDDSYALMNMRLNERVTSTDAYLYNKFLLRSYIKHAKKRHASFYRL